MNVLLGILDYYLPALPIVGIALFLLGTLYFFSHRKGADVQDEPHEDHETALRNQWDDIGYDAWSDMWKEKER